MGNMPHDFCNDPQCRQGTAKIHPRRDSRGQPCWNQNSVMDYSQRSVNKWSTCSKEAMNRLNFRTQRCNSNVSRRKNICQELPEVSDSSQSEQPVTWMANSN